MSNINLSLNSPVAVKLTAKAREDSWQLEVGSWQEVVGAIVWNFGHWNLEFVCNLEFVIWNFFIYVICTPDFRLFNISVLMY
ncbi:MAG: hypothetical protein GTO45_20015 [Candidatus Aminicenantes bacterium]|nr:hypothetical protein [Candidatus Aminicenantes bacterium]NIN87048.1 hypothetical protein [Candidatus Aminicenantes bacterium]NIO83315.1 hypothetical protein [Candidatus Aminicenantes bacterium]NIQ69245.1 hypothetical protein [Candidatus Aminicenantes bacterium]NIT25248.1 hypothetical protein [Candidatus Aminicenantes bacterium]